jgi:alpha-ketoglutarate-dependent taurine dioxygenase
MIHTAPIEFTTIEDIVDNYKKYKDVFVNDSILVFRNANLSYEEQIVLHKKLGECFGWHTFDAEDGSTAKYIENHSNNINVKKVNGDEIMLNWHIEHLHYSNPIVAATWNMITFNTDTNNGKTYFVDSEKIYNRMPDEWKNFLEVCTINGKNFNADNFKLVKDHWITGNKVVRMKVTDLKEGTEDLFMVNENTPTKEDVDLFNEILVWFGNEVINNEDIRIVHKWKQGDIVIPDLFKLAHAVTGGFDPADRKFIGIWGFLRTQG